jgi:hypothetical protein
MQLITFLVNNFHKISTKKNLFANMFRLGLTSFPIKIRLVITEIKKGGNNSMVLNVKDFPDDLHRKAKAEQEKAGRKEQGLLL